MSEETKTKKSRKAIVNYEFADQTVNLNGYVARCTVTGSEKRFYHAYLANMIVKKFNNNFAQFEDTYVSREGKSISVSVRKVESVEQRISKLYNKIRELKALRDSITV
jgi:hypothetical protein